MKELSIEEKAKRYESALERCRKLYNEAKANEYTSDIEDYETIFPELKEDEKIRESLIHLVHLYGGEFGMIDANTSVEKAIAWLEKQGESKDIDSDDLETLEIWEDTIKENKEKWQLSDWFVEATSLLIQKVKRIENNENIDIKGNKVMLNACINALRTVGHSHLSAWLEKQGQKPINDTYEELKGE